MTQLIEIEIVKDTTVWRKIADMVDEKDEYASRSRYAERACRLRQAYNTAASGRRVQLTGGYVATGAKNDLEELGLGVQDGSILVGWVDSENEFHPESCHKADDFVSYMYWQSFDVAILPVIRRGVR